MKQNFVRLYKLILRFYPRQFHAEFGDEMVVVFAENMADQPRSNAVIQFLRELRDLPGSLVDVSSAHLSRGEIMPTKNEYIVPSSRWQAFMGTLPHLAFGIVQMIDKMDSYSAPRSTYTDLAFYGLALTGLLIGWIRGFPLWSYSYLGWSLVFAWWWTNMSIGGIDWGYRIWLPFGIMILLAFLWTRSLDPLKKLLGDIWNDWTRLSLAMFAFGSWMFQIYDENHHPQLVLFILATTLVVSAGAWFFLSSPSLKGRIFSIIGSFLLAAILSGISYLTWDWRAYYGLPPSDRVINNLGLAPIGILFWLLILFWPALIALIRRLTLRRTTNP